jgi:hypothetical protein
MRIAFIAFIFFFSSYPSPLIFSSSTLKGFKKKNKISVTLTYSNETPSSVAHALSALHFGLAARGRAHSPQPPTFTRRAWVRAG